MWIVTRIKFWQNGVRVDMASKTGEDPRGVCTPWRDSRELNRLWSFVADQGVFFIFFTLATGPRSSLILKLIDTRVYEPPIRAKECTCFAPAQVV